MTQVRQFFRTFNWHFWALIYKEAQYHIWKSSDVFNGRVASQKHGNNSKVCYFPHAYLVGICKELAMAVNLVYQK